MIQMIYFGCLILGSASDLTFLATMGYIKYFPSLYVSIYVAGLGFAGPFLGGIYVLALYIGFDFQSVAFLFYDMTYCGLKYY